MKNVTDYFQSARLLGAGLPPESADYFYHKESQYSRTKKRYEPAFPYMPCWSIGALWEYIFENAGEKVYVFSTEFSTSELIDGLVDVACNIARG